MEFHLTPIVFEPDCLKLVTASKETEVDGSGLILKDIKPSLSLLPSCFFVHTFREANIIAHRAAILALQDGLTKRKS